MINKNSKVYKRLFKYLAPQSRKLFLILVCTIISTVFTIFSPKILSLAINELQDGVAANGSINYKYISQIAILLIFIYIISSIFTYIVSHSMIEIAQNMVYNIRKDVDKKLSKLPIRYFDEKPHGDIISCVTNDIEVISITLQNGIASIITSIIQAIGFLIMMLLISPLLTIIILLTIPVYIIIAALIAQKSQKYYTLQSNKKGELSSHINEMYSQNKIVKAFGYEKESISRFSEINEELNCCGWKAQFASSVIMPAITFINKMGYVIISVVGGLWMIKEKLKAGDIVALIQYANEFNEPIMEVAEITNILQAAIASAGRVFALLDEPEEIPDANNQSLKSNLNGNVEFHNVDFRYKKDVPLIENLNLHVKSREVVAIVGTSGAGKTTLVNLLMRFYDINKGKITIDGIDIKELKRNDLRSMFGMVLQDTWLFKGTIKDNIAYGRENASFEEIVAAAKMAQTDHFIRTFQDGYDTVLDGEADSISQGQKQLITIARAFLVNPAFLILDEATSNIDTRTELLVQKSINNLMKDRTCFIIAHRLSTIRNADQILVMDKGKIVETGSHDELIDKKGFYYDLYHSQYSDYESSNEVRV